MLPVIKSKYFYLGILSIIAGAGLNFASESYLHNYMSEGKTLPMLSDLILDNLPFYNVSLIYDISCLIPIVLVLIYFVHKKDYDRIPFFLLMSGIFYIVRGIFIVLTPFGNPPMFNGSDPLFHGFSNYELGVYPSGHAGNVFLMLLLVFTNNKIEQQTGWNLGLFTAFLWVYMFYYLYKAMRVVYQQARFKTVVKYFLLLFMALIMNSILFLAIFSYSFFKV